KELNPSTGVESTHKSAFSEANCAADTDDFACIADNMDEDRQDALLTHARQYIGHDGAQGYTNISTKKERARRMIDKCE
ncbi:hypothetical protein OH77DRAFT_1526145, partial [Trametes cingulata]